MSNESRDSIASYLSRVMNADGAPLPKNRVKVQIAGEEYTIVSVESEDYIRRVAALVDAKITAILDSSRIPLNDATVLAACNLADEQIKAQDTAENLRAQIKAYSDEISRLRADLSEARREPGRRQGQYYDAEICPGVAFATAPGVITANRYPRFSRGGGRY